MPCGNPRRRGDEPRRARNRRACRLWTTPCARCSSVGLRRLRGRCLRQAPSRSLSAGPADDQVGALTDWQAESELTNPCAAAALRVPLRPAGGAEPSMGRRQPNQRAAPHRPAIGQRARKIERIRYCSPGRLVAVCRELRGSSIRIRHRRGYRPLWRRRRWLRADTRRPRRRSRRMVHPFAQMPLSTCEGFEDVIRLGIALDDRHLVIVFIAIGDRHRVGRGAARQEHDHANRTHQTASIQTKRKGCTSLRLLLLLLLRRLLLRGCFFAVFFAFIVLVLPVKSPRSCPGTVNVKIFGRRCTNGFFR